HLAIENGSFESKEISLEWTTFDGGTGQMTNALRNGEIDACILLTEGIIKDIINGSRCKIISGYVNTPLIWGVHTGAKNKLTHQTEIYDKQYAISRFGSGSHLMAIVDATINGKNITQAQFNIINNLEGSIQSLVSLTTDVFYWEKYTTKPYVDSGELRRLGEFITPWPCFVIAATDDIISQESASITRMLHTIHDSCDLFMRTKDNIPLVSERYGLKLIDVERWYHATEWAIHGWVSDKMLQSVIHNLRVANIIDRKTIIPELVWKRN
ncbi:MAG: uracil-DNA glycosylase, partial [Saprospiraceae bacterium]